MLKHVNVEWTAIGRLAQVALLLLVTAVSSVAQEEGEEYYDFDSLMSSIDWVAGPDTAAVGNIARLAVPEGVIFTGRDGTQKLMEAFENPLSDMEQGFICSETFSWWAVLEWDPTGYVKDDEKADLDPDGMLEALREGTEEANKERRKRGWGELEIVGWAQPPRYEESSHNLEWATIVESDDGYQNTNHNSRVLGRRGIIHVTLVTEVDSLGYYLPEFRAAMAGFGYIPGETYAEYREGDNLAEYGLTALVVGGGAAVAAKAGLFKYLWKILAVAAAASAGFFRKFFGKGGKNHLPPATPNT